MKGQLVLEFIIAGLIFFAIIVYTINYLNVNVSDFRVKAHQNRLQTKALQVSEILMGNGPMGLADGFVLNETKLRAFNNSYCKDNAAYMRLVEDLYLYEKNSFGIFPDDIKLEILNNDGVFFECGPLTAGGVIKQVPRNITKAEAGRLGVLAGETARLEVVIW